MRGHFVGALGMCGRIKITDEAPRWIMEEMPIPRIYIMGDMVLLPNGKVLIINGASVGAACWEIGRNLVFTLVTYTPNKPLGSRFLLKNPSTIPRVYHLTVTLLRDGQVLVGGSNPHKGYTFFDVLYPTELQSILTVLFGW